MDVIRFMHNKSTQTKGEEELSMCVSVGRLCRDVSRLVAVAGHQHTLSHDPASLALSLVRHVGTTNCFEVVYGVRFCVEICEVGLAGLPGDDEVALSDAIADPVVTHVNCFGATLFYCLVGDSNSKCVVTDEWCGCLRIAQVGQRVA